ncbi:unnamed protein product, partial [marine sediment metagenome]
ISSKMDLALTGEILIGEAFSLNTDTVEKDVPPFNI